MAFLGRLWELADLAGRDDPGVRRILRNAERNPDSVRLGEALLRKICAEKGIEPMDPPVFEVPGELPDGGRLLGQALIGETRARPYRLPVAELPGNVGFLGTTGSGKSTLAGQLDEWLIERGLCSILFDVGDEYGWLVRRFGPERLAVLDARRLPLAVFGNPEGSCLDDLAWLSRVVSVFRECMFLRDGSCNVLLKVVGDMYRERGVLRGSRDCPLMTDVFGKLVACKFSANTRASGWIESLINRFQGLLQSFPWFNAKRSLVPAQILERSLLVRMADLSPWEIDVFVSLLLAWLMALLEGELRPRTAVVLVIEEAHLLTTRQKLLRYDLGEPLVVRLLRTGRKHGVSVVVVDQVPSELPAAVLGNLSTRIVMRLTNWPCIRAVGSSMGLDREQQAELSELPRRRAIVQTGTVPKPCLIEVVEVPERERPTREELQEREEASLGLLDYELGDVDVTKVLFGGAEKEREEERKTGLSADMRRVLARICESPFEFIRERKNGLGVDRGREGRARRELEKLGLAEQGAKVGARKEVWVPTAKGVAWAKEQGLPVHSYKGSIAHEVMVRHVRKAVGRFSTRVSFVSAGEALGSTGIQPDLVARVKAEDGDSSRRVVFQVSFGNKPDYEARKAVELSAVPHVDLVVVVGVNKGKARSIGSAITGVSGDRSSRSSHKAADGDSLDGRGSLFRAAPVRILDFDTCVSPDYDWGFVLG